jgi:hypothetical protein
VVVVIAVEVTAMKSIAVNEEPVWFTVYNISEAAIYGRMAIIKTAGRV